MGIEHYTFTVSHPPFEFSFDSVGPNGLVRKKIIFTLQNTNGISYFNLAFGDLNEETGEIDDLSVSNNEDRDKILATVAAAVLEFMVRFPDIPVYAQGSTPSRTRLYQMGMMANWGAIEPVLEIFGFIDGRWEKFAKGNNYQAFLAFRKRG